MAFYQVTKETQLTLGSGSRQMSVLSKIHIKVGLDWDQGEISPAALKYLEKLYVNFTDKCFHNLLGGYINLSHCHWKEFFLFFVVKQTHLIISIIGAAHSEIKMSSVSSLLQFN